MIYKIACLHGENISFSFHFCFLNVDFGNIFCNTEYKDGIRILFEDEIIEDLKHSSYMSFPSMRYLMLMEIPKCSVSKYRMITFEKPFLSFSKNNTHLKSPPPPCFVSCIVVSFFIYAAPQHRRRRKQGSATLKLASSAVLPQLSLGHSLLRSLQPIPGLGGQQLRDKQPRDRTPALPYKLARL